MYENQKHRRTKGKKHKSKTENDVIGMNDEGILSRLKERTAMNGEIGRMNVPRKTRNQARRNWKNKLAEEGKETKKKP